MLSFIILVLFLFYISINLFFQTFFILFIYVKLNVFHTEMVKTNSLFSKLSPIYILKFS